MRRLIASTFVSLDGVMQAPGAPEEDPAQGFSLGGWTFPYWDEVMGQSMAGFDGIDRELVLGRRTYELFAAYWPGQPEDHPIARTFNAAKKHVATRTLRSLHWNNSAVLGGDVASAVGALKAQPGCDLQVIGSGHLLRTLQAAALIDEYNVWTFPVVLGRGKRLFEQSARPCALRLVASKFSTTGVVMCTYVPDGDVRRGTVGEGLQGHPAPHSDAATIVQRQLDAYNAHDLQAFVATYSEDVTVYRVPGTSPALAGKQALSDFYRDNRFNLPRLHADLVHRSVIGDKIIDQERITGLHDEPLEAVAVYVVNNGLIQSVWLIYAE